MPSPPADIAHLSANLPTKIAWTWNTLDSTDA